MAQTFFNCRLSRARRIIENCFGILVARFRCLSRKLNVLPEKASLIAVTCCVLHNMLRESLPNDYFDRENNGRITNGRWRLVERDLNLCNLRVTRSSGHSTRNGQQLRDNIADYLISPNERLRFRNNLNQIYN